MSFLHKDTPYYAVDFFSLYTYQAKTLMFWTTFYLLQSGLRSVPILQKNGLQGERQEIFE